MTKRAPASPYSADARRPVCAAENAALDIVGSTLPSRPASPTMSMPGMMLKVIVPPKEGSGEAVDGRPLMESPPNPSSDARSCAVAVTGAAASTTTNGRTLERCLMMTPLARAGARMPAARVVPFDRRGLRAGDATRCDMLPVLSSAIDNIEQRPRMNFRAEAFAHEFLRPARIAA